jgi:hypothetical protein
MHYAGRHVVSGLMPSCPPLFASTPGTSPRSRHYVFKKWVLLLTHCLLSLNASATDFLGLFAFQPLSNNNSSDSKQGAASASGAHKKAAAFVAACL